MNQDIIQGKWLQVKGKIHQQWGKLTENDIATMQGSTEELVGRLQEKYGYARDKAQEEIDNFVKKNHFND